MTISSTSEGIASKFTIKIGGKDLKSLSVDTSFFEMVVDTSIHMPNMCTLRFQDTGMKLMDSATLDIGKEIEIKGSKELLFKGEITSIEPIFVHKEQTYVVVRSYDKSHRLFLTRKSQSFIQMSDSDIISKVAQDAGLSVDADRTSLIYPYVFQNNQTHMEFILERARRIGYVVYVSAEGTLAFKKGSSNLGGNTILRVGEELLEFQPRLTAAHQTNKVTVLGWDSNTKKAIKSEVTAKAPSPQAGVSKSGGATANGSYKGFKLAETTVVSQPLWNVDEAKAMAEALAAEVNSVFLQGDGVCAGDERIRAGKTIKVEGAGTRFSGKYLITSAVHVYREGNYRTHLDIHGLQGNTLHHILGGGNGQGHEPGHKVVDGLVPALVTNLEDPWNIGRVKVSFPWMGEQIESHWARLASPMAGQDNKGLYWIPEINDEVLVGFEHGDITRPYILGTLWNKKDKPPKGNNEVVKSGVVNERIIRSRSGHLIILDDTKDAEKIIIRDKTGKNEIIIDSKANSLSITVEDKINITAKGAISVKSTSNDITMEAKNITLKAQQDIAVSATQNCDIKADQTKVTGSSGVEIKTMGMGKIAVSPSSVNVNNGALEVT
ncbi:MAG: VgrG-related protein [Ardenticatenales bacterium]|nr:VgrG-related protein [Ardenticatenales bacterium]